MGPEWSEGCTYLCAYVLKKQNCEDRWQLAFEGRARVDDRMLILPFDGPCTHPHSGNAAIRLLASPGAMFPQDQRRHLSEAGGQGLGQASAQVVEAPSNSVSAERSGCARDFSCPAWTQTEGARVEQLPQAASVRVEDGHPDQVNQPVHNGIVTDDIRCTLPVVGAWWRPLRDAFAKFVSSTFEGDHSDTKTD